MLKLRRIMDASAGLVAKGMGLGLEMIGMVLGRDRLKEAGRYQQEIGSERLMAMDAEAMAVRAGTDEQERAHREARSAVDRIPVEPAPTSSTKTKQGAPSSKNARKKAARKAGGSRPASGKTGSNSRKPKTA